MNVFLGDIDVKPSPEFLALFDVEVEQHSPNLQGWYVSFYQCSVLLLAM